MQQTIRLFSAAAVLGIAAFGAHSLAESSVERGRSASCQPIEVSVFFAPGQTDLNDFGAEMLRRTITEVGHCTLSQIEVIGYADASGQSAQNMRISELRAESALQFVLNNGLDADQIRVSGVGDEGAIGPDGKPVTMRRKADMRLIPARPGA